jgi:hypothetical protein
MPHSGSKFRSTVHESGRNKVGYMGRKVIIRTKAMDRADKRAKKQMMLEPQEEEALREIIRKILDETKYDPIDLDDLHLEEEEMDEYGRPTDHDKIDEQDQDGDGDEDFADVQIARMVKSGMPKKKAIEKTADKKYNLKEAAKKYSHINFKPTKSIAAAAERGLEYRKKAGGKGGLSGKQAKKHGIGSGVQRAVNLKNRDTMSPATVRKNEELLSIRTRKEQSHRQGQEALRGSRIWVAWLLWGGDPGRSWARKIVRQMDAADKKDK